jgi:CheY-like chemotaxis protein
MPGLSCGGDAVAFFKGLPTPHIIKKQVASGNFRFRGIMGLNTAFNAGELRGHLQQLSQIKFSGVLTVTVTPPRGKVRTNVIALWNGMITYAGENQLGPMEFAEIVAKRLGVSVMDSAKKVAMARAKNPDSVKEVLDLMSRFKLFAWDDLEKQLKLEALWVLEGLLPHAGELDIVEDHPFDLSYGDDHHGFVVETILAMLAKRTELWQALAPDITSSHTVVTAIDENVATISQTVIKNHLQSWICGNHRTIFDIAKQLNKDPLELAKHYRAYIGKGWLVGEVAPSTTVPKVAASVSPAAVSNLPVVLSVDDSPIVQTMIKKFLDDRYQVKLSNNAVDALNILNTEVVDLLLLDVTMPDIDGLELCKSIRNIAKFRDLPVIMLTAKDGLIDKVKGQFSGATHYMTKPIDQTKLLEVISKYIRSSVLI